MKIRHLLLFCWSLAAGSVFIGCSGEDVRPDDPPERWPVDETQQTLLSDFSPKDAAVRTLLFINGQNFGTELQNIKVFIGGKEAPVTGSNGKTIVAMVPRNTAERVVNADQGISLASIRVKVYKADGELYFDEKFADSLNVKIQTNVGTLVGKREAATGNSSRIDGTFEEAEFQSPWWLELTRNKLGEKVLLVHDGATQDDNRYETGYLLSVREVNLETRMVRTLLTQSQIGLNQGLSIAMDPTRDTLFILNDNGRGSWNDRYAMPAVYYALRNDDFLKSRPYQYAQCSYSGVWMSDGTFYYNTWESGMLLRGRETYNAEVGMWDGKPLFSTFGNNGAHQYMIKHPSENYMYVTGVTKRITRVPYDKAQKTFVNNVTIVAGLDNGFAEGTGPSARFGNTRQGVFVKNPDYTGEELYDFYMCDQGNNCIWKITPTGIATVFAGRGSPGLNSDRWGWIDGDPIKSARFDQPCGIAYDEETGIFYIADRQNRRIRTIMIE